VPKLIGPQRVKDKEAAKKIADKLKNLRDRMTAPEKDAYSDYETHGCVWLFLREPTAKKSAQ
jgi:hypothetical protein